VAQYFLPCLLSLGDLDVVYPEKVQAGVNNFATSGPDGIPPKVLKYGVKQQVRVAPHPRDLLEPALHLTRYQRCKQLLYTRTRATNKNTT